MSLSSSRGKAFEQLVARLIRSKLNAKVMRDARSGAGTNKADMSDWFRQLPLSIECKDQQTIKIKEWFKQAVQARSYNRTPTLVFRADGEILATLRFSDLLDFLLEVKQQAAEIEDLRQPNKNVPSPELRDHLLKPKADMEYTCRNGHLSDIYGRCQILDCKFSRGYRPPKVKGGAR